MKILTILLLAAMAAGAAQRPPLKPLSAPFELLWPGGAPGAVGSEDADRPGLYLFVPPADRATGAAVVVCPGGGYTWLAMDHEGEQIARWLNSFGVAAFVLRYRHAPRYHAPAPLQDAQRAIRMVRTRAKEWRVLPDRIGIWGFSAGGHLASTAGTKFDDGEPGAADAIGRASSRPDFMILSYPVISFTTAYTHTGSRRNLLGENPDPKLVESYSNELQVTARTPPAFLFHTNADTGVPPENSVLFYMALRKAGVPAEMHIFERGQHGLGLAQYDLAASAWPARLAEWMRVRGFLTAAPFR